MKTLTQSQRILFPTTPSQEDIIYPESDGQPMSDNTKQFRAITTIQGNLDSLYAQNPQVLVVGDLLWYPVQGDDKTCRAPDIMVVFGVSKGDRRSYLQWQENNIPPQVVFEIRSSSNTHQEMREKRMFYEDYGVLEYYMYDPDRGTLEGWQRRGRKLRQIGTMSGWVSPQLNIRFDLISSELKLYYPDGKPFLTFPELNEQRQVAERRAIQAEENLKAEAEARAAAEENLKAEAEARATAEENLKAEAEARAAAEVNFKAETQARAIAEENLKTEAEARAAAEARLREAEEKLRDLGLL